MHVTNTFLCRLDARGFNYVAVRRGHKASGYLCKRESDAKTKQSKLVSFDTIRTAVAYVAHDCYFLLGDTVVERIRGHPMGGSFSEPLTLLDLGERVYRMHNSIQLQHFVGWRCDSKRIPKQHHDHTAAPKLVDGVQHVDDALVFSNVFCSECLHKGVSKLWPKDVGAKLEESGLSISFLHTTIVVQPHTSTYAITPTVVNFDFARGEAEFCEQSRVTPCIHHSITDRNMLRVLMLGRFVMFNQIVAGKPKHAMVAIASYVCEVYLSAWPIKIIGHAITSFPRRHASFLFVVLRIFSQYLRKWPYKGAFDFPTCLALLHVARAAAARHAVIF